MERKKLVFSSRKNYLPLASFWLSTVTVVMYGKLALIKPMLNRIKLSILISLLIVYLSLLFEFEHFASLFLTLHSQNCWFFSLSFFLLFLYTKFFMTALACTATLLFRCVNILLCFFLSIKLLNCDLWHLTNFCNVARVDGARSFDVIVSAPVTVEIRTNSTAHLSLSKLAHFHAFILSACRSGETRKRHPKQKKKKKEKSFSFILINFRSSSQKVCVYDIISLYIVTLFFSSVAFRIWILGDFL